MASRNDALPSGFVVEKEGPGVFEPTFLLIVFVIFNTFSAVQMRNLICAILNSSCYAALMSMRSAILCTRFFLLRDRPPHLPSPRFA